jgi:DNA-binding CsgD family transcriptional regulator
MIGLAKATQPTRSGSDPLPATTRLRAGILLAADGEELVALFAGALAEHGITGHFCVHAVGGRLAPILGDHPGLVAGLPGCLDIAVGGAFKYARVLLAPPEQPLNREAYARIKGYAELFAARALALQEMADDVDTNCGLSLRERYVLGRRLAGLAPVDIALETGLSMETIAAASDSAVARLNADNVAGAIAVAARRGWLAVTNLQNCSSSSEKISYTMNKNG